MRPTLTSEPERSISPVCFAFGFSPRHTLSASGISSTGGSAVLLPPLVFGIAFGSSGIAWSITSGSHARGLPTLRTYAPCDQRRTFSLVIERSRRPQDSPEAPLALVSAHSVAEPAVEFGCLLPCYRAGEPPVKMVPPWRRLDKSGRLWPVIRHSRTVAVYPEGLDLAGVLPLARSRLAEQVNSEESISLRF